MKIGIISPAEIAMRRFLPALQKCKEFDFAGIAVNSKDERFKKPYPCDRIVDEILYTGRNKAMKIIGQFGGVLYNSYASIIDDPSIEAIYIPLPPALHYKWAKLALDKGKHVMVEKPSTLSGKEARELIQVADQKGLALHENYMFVYHKQLEDIQKIIQNGEIGDIRLYRISFGFPRREKNDFRYHRDLGGGALFDAGGYTIKYATYLLGPTAKLMYAQSSYIDEFDVDIFGSAAFVNSDGIPAQISFGMDNEYKCDLEVWGSRGCLMSGRVLTAPSGFIPKAVIRKNGKDTIIDLSADDTFVKSIKAFKQCIFEEKARKEEYYTILRQAQQVDDFRIKAGENGCTNDK